MGIWQIDPNTQKQRFFWKYLVASYKFQLHFQNVIHLFILGHISGSLSKTGAGVEEDLQVFISYLLA